MYFWEFQSYSDRVKAAKQFVINVALVDRPGVEASNVMPIAAWPHAMNTLLMWQEEKGPFTLWNGTKVTSIPYEQIRSVTFVLDPAE